MSCNNLTKGIGENVEKEVPIACTRDSGAFEGQQAERYATLRKEMRGAGQGIRELPDGYAFSFSGDTSVFLKIAEWITMESLCCPFFKFSLDFDPEGNQIWLKLTGRSGVKQLLEMEIGRK